MMGGRLYTLLSSVVRLCSLSALSTPRHPATRRCLSRRRSRVRNACLQQCVRQATSVQNDDTSVMVVEPLPERNGTCSKVGGHGRGGALAFIMVERLFLLFLLWLEEVLGR